MKYLSWDILSEEKMKIAHTKRDTWLKYWVSKNPLRTGMEKNSSQFLSLAPVRGSEVVHNNDATYITLHSCNAIVMDSLYIYIYLSNGRIL